MLPWAKGDKENGKDSCNYFGLSMAAEGQERFFVGRQAAAFLGYVQRDAERCAANCGSAEDLSAAPEEIKRKSCATTRNCAVRRQTAPGVEHDVVAIYDNAGIPSIMHRFRRVTNKGAFGGSDAGTRRSSSAARCTTKFIFPSTKTP